MFEDINRKTVYIMGKKFLECPHENCEWNIGWLGGIDWTEERGNVIEMARAEFEF
jgi:hypothetical protein